jgi:ubiquitin-protein ligase
VKALGSTALERITKEIQILCDDPLPGIVLRPLLQGSSIVRNMYMWYQAITFHLKSALHILNPPFICDHLTIIVLQLTVEIAGPDGTPYESGTFILEIAIPENYPSEAPQCMLMVALNFWFFLIQF